MITNVPTPEALHKSALSFFFEAWSLVLTIATEFDEVYSPDESSYDWTSEKTDHLKKSQRDLQKALSGMQQASELALKARIADVSPFLLLIGSSQRLTQKPSDLDFSEFKTLDAQDLPSAVNCLTSAPLSDQFSQDYRELRGLRNKIVHLGTIDKHFSPDELLSRMVRQFADLWPTRRWLVERLSYASSGRYSAFHDGKYSSAEGEVFAELDETLSRIPKAIFKQVIGFDKNARRYLCPDCLYRSEARNAGLDLETCQTAYALPDRTKIKCAMCNEDFSIVRVKCVEPDCKGEVRYDAPDDAPFCLTCGEYEE